MKRIGLIIAVLAIVLSLALPLAAEDAPKPKTPQRGSRGSWMQARAKIYETIEAEITKMKTPVKGMPKSREDYQKLTEEQKTDMRKKFTKMREDRIKSITVLQDQVSKLKGARALTTEHDKEIKQLTAVKELAVKEESKETAAAIEKIIAEKKKAFETTMKKLELEPRRGGRGGRR